MEHEYVVVEVGESIDDLLGDISTAFATYKEAFKWGTYLTHERWTIVRRK